MSTIKQYAAWAEKRIARTIISEGVSAGLLSVRQGPLALSFEIKVLPGKALPFSTRKPLTLGASLRKVLTLGPALAQALQADSVRVSEGTGSVLIEVPLPSEAQRTPTSSELARVSRGVRVAVGFDGARRPVHVDLQQHGALLWIGPSRRGKTQSMRCTLFALAQGSTRLNYLILCHERKRADWQAFEGAEGCLGIVSDPDEQSQALEWVASSLLTKSTGRRFVVLCDDLLNLLERADLSGPLAEIASMGAGLGVHLLAGTQEGGSKRGTGGAGVENNATAKILYRNSNAAAAARAAGQGSEGVQQLSGAKGDAVLLLDGEAQRVATGLADDRDILQLAQGAGWLRPWLRATARNLEQLHTTGTTTHQGTPAGLDVQPGASERQGGDGVAVEVVEGVALPLGLAQQVGAHFPIERHPPTEAEGTLLAQLAALGMSKSALCRVAYGHKDGAAWAWVGEAIERGAEQSKGKEGEKSSTKATKRGAERRFEGAEGELPGSIDLSTAEGAALWQAMQRQGLIKLPDVASLLQ